MKYFLYGLTLAFIVLKLVGYIDWSWWLVLLPLYGLILFWCFLIVLYIVAKLAKNRKDSIKQFEGNRKSKFQERLDAYMKEQQANKLR